MNQRIRPYEGVVILVPEASEETQKTLFKKNKKIIEGFKGTLHSVDTWGRRKLCNPIRKERTGLYFHVTFMAGTECIAELERTMRINDSILRFMHVRLDERVELDKHLQKFKETLAEVHAREAKEREIREQRKRERRPSMPM